MTHQAIYALNPTVVTIRGDVAYDAEGNEVQYDQSAVDAYIQEHAYIEQRQRAYPSIADQLDKIFHEGIDAWKTQIQAVKDAYPK